MAHQFDVVDSEVALEASIIAVRRGQVQMPGGNVSARGVVEHLGAVAAAATDEDNRLYLLNQWWRTVGKRLMELSAGPLGVADEDPLETAKRKLVERARLEAES